MHQLLRNQLSQNSVVKNTHALLDVVGSALIQVSALWCYFEVSKRRLEWNGDV